MSPSSVEVTYRPEGPGHRARTARADLGRIPDPEAWLTNRLGRLAQCDIAAVLDGQAARHDRLDALASRLASGMQTALASNRAALDALSARLDAAAPVGVHQPPSANPTEEN